jgi:hypothetical protein
VVKAPGLPEASSITTIPDMVKIEHVDTSRTIGTEQIFFLNQNSSFPGISNVHLTCNIEFTDPLNETNYYLFNIYKSYKETDNKISTCINFHCNDPIIEERVESATGSHPLKAIAFSDKLINGKKNNFVITLDCNEIGLPFCWNGESMSSDHLYTGYYRKVIYFRLYSITEDYFKYIQTLNLFIKKYDNPLSDPVLVYSNIDSGYGIFASAAVSSDSIVFQYYKYDTLYYK